MDFPGLAQFLTGMGPAGIIIGYLLWERAGLTKKLDESRAAHMADIKKYSGDYASSLATSTAVLSANNAASEKAAGSAQLISEAVRTVAMKLELVEDAIEKFERARS